MLHYESIPPRVSSKRSRDDAERSLRMRIKFITIDLSNCFVKFAHEKESLAIDVLARFLIMNVSVRVTKWNAMHIYNIPSYAFLEVRDI